MQRRMRSFASTRRVTFTFAWQCCPMTVDNDTHTYTHMWGYTYVCVHCSSRQMTVEWQRTNKTHVKNRTCNEQNKPQRDRERETKREREGQHRRRRPAWLSFLALSFFYGLKISPVCQKIKAAPICANLRRICHPRCRERHKKTRERNKEREIEREQERVSIARAR